MTKFYRPVGDKACVFPIGSVIFTDNSTNPTKWYGGTWTRLSGGFIYACVNNYSVGNTGSTTNTGDTTLTKSQIPAHTHSRGTMNITGTLGLGWNDSSAPTLILNRGWSGALSGSNSGAGNQYYSYTGSGPYSHYNDTLKLNAADGWSGSTSSVGGSGSHNHTISYIAVFCWRRTA